MRAEQFITDSISSPQSSVFDLSHDNKLSLNMGDLVPVLVQDCMPGDKFRIRPETMMRLAPLASPMMHRVTATIHFFFVPNRILWDQWQNWITNNLSADTLHPSLQLKEGIDRSRMLFDYIGFPNQNNPTIDVNAFPVAAYYKIFDEYYRDENLVDETFTPLVAGNNDTAYDNMAPLLKRAWMHDYFTSCLPFAQKGDPVQLPLVGDGNGQVIVEQRTDVEPSWWTAHQSFTTGHPGAVTGQAFYANTPSQGTLEDDAGNTLFLDPNGNLVVDLSAQAATINSLRQAFALQEWLERNARGGTRYIEQIKAHFGVSSSDARLQRPEYIGGLKQNMVISEVLSTASTSNGDNSTLVGDMYGHGISVSAGDSAYWFCEEHGWIIGLLSVMPDTAYYQGIERKFSRLDIYDYPWPSFAHLGEQEVLNKEIYALQTDIETANGVFGWIPRYSELRFTNNRISGEFRTNLDYWHMARLFSTPPVLNDEFIQANPTFRVFNYIDPDADHVYAQIYFDITASRKLPKFGTPYLIG